MAAPLTFAPYLMPAAQAAHFIGVSESTLRGLNLPRRMLGKKRLYHINDLIAYADALPIEGESEDEACDNLFGLTG